MKVRNSNISKNKEVLKLPGLSKGEYDIDGYVTGVPKTIPEVKKELNIDDYVTWIR